MFSYPIVALVAFLLGWYANDKFVTFKGLASAIKSGATRFVEWVKSFRSAS